MMELEQLKKENTDLRRKLNIAKLWMEREVRAHVKKIAKGKISFMESSTQDIFYGENIEETITKKISDFFGEVLLLNVPASVIENIISAEISYFNLRENPNADGLGVISSYHKALDALIESFITKGFRKYAKKKGQTQLRKNDSLEKSLNSVVNLGYILSVGRLYHLLTVINDEDEELLDYAKCFKEYIEKYESISNIVNNISFIKNFESLVDSEILGKKRHVGKISFIETRTARNLLIGDFEDTDCLLYKFMEIAKMEY